jgi:predicted hydrocarbon binding protein
MPRNRRSSSSREQKMNETRSLHERLRFDTDRGEVLDASRRYVLLRADVLMGMFDALPGASREQALAAFGRSVDRFGSDSVRAYAAEVGPSALLDAMRDAAASLGWGRWHFEADERILRLTVHNSPFAGSTACAGSPACHAIAGMLQALASTLWPEGAGAHEVSCAAQQHGGAALCRFEARPIANPDNPPQGTAR